MKYNIVSRKTIILNHSNCLIVNDVKLEPFIAYAITQYIFSPRFNHILKKGEDVEKYGGGKCGYISRRATISVKYGDKKIERR